MNSGFIFVIYGGLNVYKCYFLCDSGNNDDLK